MYYGVVFLVRRGPLGEAAIFNLAETQSAPLFGDPPFLGIPPFYKALPRLATPTAWQRAIFLAESLFFC